MLLSILPNLVYLLAVRVVLGFGLGKRAAAYVGRGIMALSLGLGIVEAVLVR